MLRSYNALDDYIYLLSIKMNTGLLILLMEFSTLHFDIYYIAFRIL